MIHWYAGGLSSLFVTMAAAQTAYACMIVVAMKAGAWRVSTTTR